MIHKEIKICPNCKGKMNPVPDSLAICCAKCGHILALGASDRYRAGTTMQEWMKSLKVMNFESVAKKIKIDQSTLLRWLENEINLTIRCSDWRKYKFNQQEFDWILSYSKVPDSDVLDNLSNQEIENIRKTI